MTALDPTTAELIGSVYACVSDAGAWNSTLELIASVTRTDAVSLRRVDGAHLSGVPVAACGYDEALRRHAAVVLAAPHPLMDGASDALETGATVLGCADEPPLSGTAFRDRWMVPQGFRHCVLLGLGAGGVGRFVLESMGRPEQAPAHPVVAALGTVAPHLVRAIELAARLGTLPAQDGADSTPGRGAASASGRNPEDVRLRTYYRLTPAEIRLARLAASGLGLRQMAEQLHVSLNTVRTHLHSIYEKTDTGRQAELMALLLNGPAQLTPKPVTVEPAPSD